MGPHPSQVLRANVEVGYESERDGQERKHATARRRLEDRRDVERHRRPSDRRVRCPGHRPVSRARRQRVAATTWDLKECHLPNDLPPVIACEQTREQLVERPVAASRQDSMVRQQIILLANDPRSVLWRLGVQHIDVRTGCREDRQGLPLDELPRVALPAFRVHDDEEFPSLWDGCRLHVRLDLRQGCPDEEGGSLHCRRVLLPIHNARPFSSPFEPQEVGSLDVDLAVGQRATPTEHPELHRLSERELDASSFLERILDGSGLRTRLRGQEQTIGERQERFRHVITRFINSEASAWPTFPSPFSWAVAGGWSAPLPP